MIFSANSSNKNFHREGAKTAKGKVLVFCSEKNEGDSIKNLSAFGKKIAFFAVFAPSRLSFLGSFVFALAFVSGCASVGIRDSSLQLQISPQPVLRGQPALAQINAPLDAEHVTGVVLVTGSPRLEFQKDADKGLWYFYGKIPFSPWILPGDYIVRVLVYEPHEKPHYTEMKVTLK